MRNHSEQKLLIGCPVCQTPAILYLFLHSLQRLEIPGCAIYYHFIDDNDNEQASQLLASFQKGESNIEVERIETALKTQPYKDHSWNQRIIRKVADFKDHLIERARQEDFDYLFLVDSDLLLHPQTIQKLMEAQKDIISEVFWTRWAEDAIEQPQVWLYDFYTQYQIGPNEKISEEEKLRRTFAFFDKLRQPGVYEVGGLGACTLISKQALNKDISFRRISNLSFWGEDRHFCVRAKVLGLDLFVDTHYPAYHIYRLSDLKGGMAFLGQTTPEEEAEPQQNIVEK